jgi:hypothetical protein
MTAAIELRRQRRIRLTRTVHALGARAFFEFVDEIARHHDLAEDIDRRLERYASRLTPDRLRVSGGDRFPHPPLVAVAGGRR